MVEVLARIVPQVSDPMGFSYIASTDIANS